MSLSLLKTADGSHSLHRDDMGEGYHSTQGAVSEALHVYIRPNLLEKISSCVPSQPINLFEMGFGTGLNALLTLLESEREGIDIRYTTVEMYPLSSEFYTALNYAETCCSLAGFQEYLSLASRWFLSMHEAAWGEWCCITPHFAIKKLQMDICTLDFPENSFDCVYYDAFAPQFQPDLWTVDLFQRLFYAMRDDAILTTYCCKGDVKRALKTAGFHIEKIPGFANKREMLRAKKILCNW